MPVTVKTFTSSHDAAAALSSDHSARITSVPPPR
jgi:hypothetical protein